MTPKQALSELSERVDKLIDVCHASRDWDREQRAFIDGLIDILRTAITCPMNPTQAEAMEALESLSDYAPSHPYAASLRGCLHAYLKASGEPVAWRVRGFADGWIYSESDTLKYSEMTGAFSQPLYTHPQLVAVYNGDVRELLRRFDAAGKDLEDCRKRLGEIHVWDCSFDGKGLASELLRQAIGGDREADK